MGRKTVRFCFSTTCSELLANRPSICSLNGHPGKLSVFPLGLSEKTTPQSLPNHPYLPGFFSSLNAAGMNSSGLSSLLAGSLKLTFQTQPLPWREERRVESHLSLCSNFISSKDLFIQNTCLLSISLCVSTWLYFSSLDLFSSRK